MPACVDLSSARSKEGRADPQRRSSSSQERQQHPYSCGARARKPGRGQNGPCRTFFRGHFVSIGVVGGLPTRGRRPSGKPMIGPSFFGYHRDPFKLMLLRGAKTKDSWGSAQDFFSVLLNPHGSCPEKTTQYFEILGETKF